MGIELKFKNGTLYVTFLNKIFQEEKFFSHRVRTNFKKKKDSFEFIGFVNLYTAYIEITPTIFRL